MSSHFKRLRVDPDLFGDVNPLLEDKESINPFDSLPKEIIQEICMLLSLRDKMSLRLVNRQLYTICSDPYLWRNVFIDDPYHKMSAPFIKSALKTCQPHVQLLSLRGQLSFSQYRSKILNCKSIHTLNLYGIEITNNELEKIASLTQLPHLQYLTIKNDLKNQEAFSCLSKIKKLVAHSDDGLLFDRWASNNFLPQILIIVSRHSLIRRFPIPPIAHSAHFALYERDCRPLDFDFYDVPKYSLQLGPNNAESVAVTADGELHITMKNMITPTSQPNDEDICQQYAVFEDKDIALGLPVYTSQCGVNITVLGFSSVTISLESFRLIVQDTPNVLEVSFKGSYVTDGLDSYLAPLSEHCLKLRGLNMSKLKPSTGDSLKVDV
uniref:F-box domain-containing protein n=1 Tax=Amphimedon queenslandica TaxID=400682 RepID=A0A1X7VLD3_AMPQE